MSHTVFVYGTLRTGLPNWSAMLAPVQGELGITQPEFTMRTLGRFPMVQRGGETAVTGEVMAVSGSQLAAIDELERHPAWYCREEITVQLHQGGAVTAWIYMLPPGTHPDAPIIESGNWVQHLRRQV